MQLGHLGHWALLVSQVIEEPQGLLETLDNLETLASRDLKVLLGNLDSLVHRGHREIVVCLVHLELLDLQVCIVNFFENTGEHSLARFITFFPFS